ncbi:MAG: hypothetical protein IJS47_06435 [Clostridia bacterium]|nr:hypothetical protein [Clostridia bacterium]
MKKLLKIVSLVMIVCIAVCALSGCGSKTEDEEEVSTPVAAPEAAPISDEEIGTAGSNIPLKDNYYEAEYQIKVAMEKLLSEVYGSQMLANTVNVDKIYTTEDEEEVPALKEMNLGPDKIAFEVSYEIRPAADVDPIIFTVPDGYYDEESSWVKDCHRLGILVPDEEGEEDYKIINYGTGW